MRLRLKPFNVTVSKGTYHLSGTSVLSAGTQPIGNSGSGTITQLAGHNTVNGILFVGALAGGSGSYALSGGSLAASNLHVGYSGTGGITQSRGIHTVANELRLGNATGSFGKPGKVRGSGRSKFKSARNEISCQVAPMLAHLRSEACSTRQ